MPELVALEAPVQEFAQDYADLEETSFVPQTEEQVLRTVFIDSSKLPLAAYLIFNGRLMQDLLTKFNRVVDVGCCAATPPRPSPTTFCLDDAKRSRCRCGQNRQLRKQRFRAN